MGKKAEKAQNTVQTPPVGQLASGKVYVVGHKNPDTDSICSAIAYAALKHKITGMYMRREEPARSMRRPLTY